MLMIFVYPIGVPLLYAYMLYVVHGDTMRRMRANEALRNKLRVEALYELLNDRLERREVTKATRRRAERTAHAPPKPPIVLFPNDDEIPPNVQRHIEELEERNKEMHNSLPDYMKKLVSGYRMNNFAFEIFECVRKLALVCMPVFFVR